jgi:hypothetical protein
MSCEACMLPSASRRGLHVYRSTLPACQKCHGREEEGEERKNQGKGGSREQGLGWAFVPIGASSRRQWHRLVREEWGSLSDKAACDKSYWHEVDSLALPALSPKIRRRFAPALGAALEPKLTDPPTAERSRAGASGKKGKREKGKERRKK